MESIALIGAKGYIGKHLEWFFKKHGYYVESYDIFSSNDKEMYRTCDVSKRWQLDNVNLNVDYIYMFAGRTGTKSGFDQYEEFVSCNELGLLNLLDAIRKSPYRPRLIFPSSRLVYKGQEKPLREDDEKETKTVYAVNKLTCENLLYAYCNMYGIPYTIYRICVPFGNMLSRDYSFGTVGFFIRQAKENGVITLYGDGNNRRTFTSMEDLCYQIVTSANMTESQNHVFNIGGCVYTLKEVAQIIASHYNAVVNFIPFPEEDLKIESGSTFFDSTRIEELTGYRKYQNVESLFK